ncbi:MAG TPA: HIT domain-containing protein [Thermomicrobiales bacterium]
MSSEHDRVRDDARFEELPNHPIEHQRLWTPWRMRYVGGGAKEAGCLFCNRLAASDDVQSLIVHRGESAFLIMNLFPYNTGHLMIVPNEHVASPEAASEAAIQGMAALLPPTLRALRRVLTCDGFNVGFNIGDVAGAGVAGHLHQHIVPRWKGDANFMPILASTMVLPELIPVTYAKVRAEVARELAHEGDKAATIRLVILSEDGAAVAIEDRAEGSALPVARAEATEPLWKAAVRHAASLGVTTEIAGWAGSRRAQPGGQPAMALRALAPVEGSGQPNFAPVTEAERRLTDERDKEALSAARALLG